MGQVPQKEKKTQPQTESERDEGNTGSKYEGLVKKIRPPNRTMSMKKEKERLC